MNNSRKIRWWMLIYTIAIGLIGILAAVSRRNEAKPHHSIAFQILEGVGVGLMFSGNFLYAFCYVRPLIRRVFKVGFPLIIASVVAAEVSVYFEKADHPVSLGAHIFGWGAMAALFFLSFRASFLLGFGDVNRVRTSERPVVMSEEPLRDLIGEMTKMRRTAQVAWIAVISLLFALVVNSYFQYHFEPKSDSWMTVRRLADRGKYAEALPIARHLIEKDPDSPDLWVLMGNLQLSLGQLHQSEGSYTRAYELLPNEVTSSLLNAVRKRIDETEPTPTPTTSP
jgi:tetratricopeptide (TPR) repeat protein